MAALVYASRSPSQALGQAPGQAPDSPFEIVLVASDNPQAAGLKIAEAEGIATCAHPLGDLPRAQHEALMQESLTAARADYIVLAGYMRILTAEFVQQWNERILNIHPSLLPAYKGLDTHKRALAAGESHSGCSVHVVTAPLDSGPVLGQSTVAILSGDTPEQLAARVQIAEHQLYARCLAAYVSRETNPDWIMAKVDALALALPETSYRKSHGAPGWRVGSKSSGKYFAHLAIHHHGEERIALLVKTSGCDEMASLIEQDSHIYHRPAYYGASGWIGYRLDRIGVDWDHVTQWLGRSWQAVAPRRLLKSPEFANKFTNEFTDAFAP